MLKKFVIKLMYAFAFLGLLLWCVGLVYKKTTTSWIYFRDSSTKVSSKLSNTNDLSSESSSPSASLIFKTLTIEEKVEGCMRMANLDSQQLITQARDNARYFLDEHRKVIPEKGLEGYRSHCWKEKYSAKWKSRLVSGNVGNVTFQSAKTTFNYYVVPDNLARLYKKKGYESSVVCLPKVYLVGYEKCGSTFLFSFIDHLIARSTNNSVEMEFEKEPQYWVRFEAYESAKKRMPKVEGLGVYLLNYIPGMDAVSKQNKTDVVLIDGTPNSMVEWPIFSKAENNLSNYCLLPAVLPTLFPGSKYIAIMRNPLDMLYSNFWFSCTKNGINKIHNSTNYGPDIFHNRIMSKIQTFNNCMRNTSVPSISSPCTLNIHYSVCIKERLHLLDQCIDDIIAHKYSPELPRCGDTTLYSGIFYVHVRKWLNLVGRDNMLLLTLEEVNQSPSKVANDTLHFLELKLSDSEIGKFAEKIMERGRKNSQTTVNYKADPKLQMRPETRTSLETFYHPFNMLLVELLGSNKFMWF